MTELVLVVITIGVIVALGVPQYQNVMRDTRQKTTKLSLNLIKSAQEVYFDENNQTYFPAAPGTSGISAINSNLNLSITEDVMLYSCTYDGGTDYDCQARFPKTGTLEWYCQITKDMEEAQCF